MPSQRWASRFPASSVAIFNIPLRAEQNGLIVKDRLALERARNLDIVISIKTGTVRGVLLAVMRNHCQPLALRKSE